MQLGRKRRVKPSLMRLKRLYESHNLCVFPYIGAHGKPGMLVIVEWEEREGLFYRLTEIGGDLLMQVYREHPGFVIRREFINAANVRRLCHLQKSHLHKEGEKT